MTVSEEKIIASLTRDSFFDFVKEFWSTIIADSPIYNWHVEYLCGELQTVAERVFRNEEKLYDLVINIPPGSTKSTICSQMFPAWVWTRMPHAQFICASYADQVALKDAIRCRDIVQSELYQKCFQGLQLRADVNSKHLFANSKGGLRWSTGVGGSVTGQHGHFLLVDDAINPEESFSEAELLTKNRWMTQTLPSRKVRSSENCVPIIAIGQRLHQADPYGEFLERSKGVGIKHICLPGEITPDVSPKELIERYVDGLLDPIRFPRVVLDELKRDLGEYGYAAQICQSPVPLSGGMFKVDKFNYVQEVPKGIQHLVRSWDKAGTEGGGAWSVGTLIGMDKAGRIWILDVVRGQWGATEREAMIDKTAMDDGNDVDIVIEIEGGSGGKESAEGTKMRLTRKGFRVFAFHPTGDKESRAYEYANQVGSGNVFVLNRNWTNVFIEEHRFFPHSKFKDQIDSASQGFNYLHKPRVKIGGWKSR